MNKDNFKLLRIEENDGYQDYWYKPDTITSEFLTDKYMEQSMVEVTEVVFSKTEDIIGIKRLFPFNFDVISPNDEELHSILKELSQ